MHNAQSISHHSYHSHHHHYHPHPHYHQYHRHHHQYHHHHCHHHHPHDSRRSSTSVAIDQTVCLTRSISTQVDIHNPHSPTELVVSHQIYPFSISSKQIFFPPNGLPLELTDVRGVEEERWIGQEHATSPSTRVLLFLPGSHVITPLMITIRLWAPSASRTIG